MHVLIVPSELYLPAWRHTSGIFQRQAAAALVREGHRVGVLSVGFLTVPNFTLAIRAAAGTGIGVDVPGGAHIVRSWIPLPLPYRWLSPQTLRGVVELSAQRAFDRYVDRHGLPDVLHGHDPLWGGWIANLLAHRSGRVSILTVHTSLFARGLASSDERALAARALSEAGALSAVSESLAASLRSQFDSPEPVVLPNVVDDDFLLNPRASAKDAAFAFFSAGSLDDNKNHAMLLEAFARAFRGTTAALRIAGDGPLRRALSARARDLGIDAQVSFLGWIDKPAMLRELSAAGCYVLSSRYETFGVALLEAIASGVPVVATRCGGPEGVVGPDCGYIVEPDDADAMADAMLRVSQSRGVYDPERLKLYAARRFGPAAYVAQLTHLFATATRTRKSPR